MNSSKNPSGYVPLTIHELTAGNQKQSHGKNGRQRRMGSRDDGGENGRGDREYHKSTQRHRSGPRKKHR